MMYILRLKRSLELMEVKRSIQMTQPMLWLRRNAMPAPKHKTPNTAPEILPGYAMKRLTEG